MFEDPDFMAAAALTIQMIRMNFADRFLPERERSANCCNINIKVFCAGTVVSCSSLICYVGYTTACAAMLPFITKHHPSDSHRP